jgi:hypothetical protein
MNNKNVVSLRRFRARQCYQRYIRLPVAQRTNARCALVLEAIFDYAYEHVPRRDRYSRRQVRVTIEESRRISTRLEEFIPPEDNKNTDPIMQWLHDNMLPEAWSHPDELRHFVRECIRNI